jgi:hypothetical protein
MGPNRVSVYLLHQLRMKTDPVCKTLCFLAFRILGDGHSPKTIVILSVIHHRQKPLESNIFIIHAILSIYSLFSSSSCTHECKILSARIV